MTTGGRASSATDVRVRDILAWLERRGTTRNRDGMARYGIVGTNAFGVAVADLRDRAKRLGKDHELALALWDTGSFEARVPAVFVDEPSRVTPAQMDRWARGFDNWAVCDAACFHLFDKTPHAFAKVAAWATRREEFLKRAAFALLASVVLHDNRHLSTFVPVLPIPLGRADHLGHGHDARRPSRRRNSRPCSGSGAARRR